MRLITLFKRSENWIIGLLIGFKAYLIFWQFNFGKFLVAPGGDQINHINFAESLSVGSLNFTYPPFFHIILRLITDYFYSGDYLLSIKAIAPYLLLIPIVMVYFLTKELFSGKTALWALVLTVFASAYPLFNFADGSYPDLINYGLFVPLSIIFFIRCLKSGRWIDGILSAVFIGFSFSTHHLSSITLISFLLPTLTILLIFKSKYFQADELYRLYRIMAIYIIFAVVWAVILKVTFGNALWEAIKNALSQGIAPVNHPFASKPYQFDEINIIVRPLIEFIGLAGLIMMLGDYQNHKKEKTLLFVWVVAVWLLSRLNIFGLPPRFLRHLELPLIIAGGYFINFCIQSARNNMQKILIGGFVGFAIVINMVQVNSQPFILPDGFYPWVWYREIDQAKYEYLTNNIGAADIIITNPSNPYLNYKLSKKLKISVIANPQIEICNEKKFNTQKDKESCAAERQEKVNEVVRASKIQYIFIGKKPYDINEEVFAEYNGFKEVTDYLNSYEKGKIVKQFLDGSKLIKIEEPETKSSKKK